MAGGYLAPRREEHLKWRVQATGSREVSADAAGIIATLYAEWIGEPDGG